MNLSPALEELVKRRDQLKEQYDRALAANNKAAQAEGRLEALLKLEWGKAYLAYRTSHKEGERPMPETDAKAHADIDTDALRLEFLAAQAVRRASSEALGIWISDIKFLESACHAHNRELKTLGG